jgi:hypothetical protein
VNAPAVVTPFPSAPRGRTRTAPETTFARDDEGLWVATHAGYFGGTIAQHGTHFFSMDTFGRYIGDFGTLAIAQRRLTDHLTTLFTREGTAA